MEGLKRLGVCGNKSLPEPFSPETLEIDFWLTFCAQDLRIQLLEVEASMIQ